MKKQLLVAMLALFGGAISLNAMTSTKEIIHLDEKDYQRKIDGFFKGLAKKHKGTIVLHRQSGTAPVKGEVIASYKNPAIGGKRAGAALEEVEVYYKQSPKALASEGKEAILKEIDKHFTKKAKMHGGELVLNRHEGTPMGTEIASYENPDYQKGKAMGGQSSHVIVEFTGSKMKMAPVTTPTTGGKRR